MMAVTTKNAENKKSFGKNLVKWDFSGYSLSAMKEKGGIVNEYN